MNKVKNLLNFYIISINSLYIGENSQIPGFGKICSKLALFQKYLAIHHFFSTRVPQNRVLNSTQVQWIRVSSKSSAWHR